MINSDHLQRLSAPLAVVLRAEIELGNRVEESSEGWPEPRTILVFLAHPFLGEYGHLPLEYRSVDDPHYWKAEYVDPQSGHVLACKFGDSV